MVLLWQGANYDVIDLLIGSESLIGLSGVPNNAVDIRYATDLGSQNVTKIGSKVLLDYEEVVDLINHLQVEY